MRRRPGGRALEALDRAARRHRRLRRAARVAGAAATLREPGRFALRELSGRYRRAAYTLRESGLVAHLRQPLIDMWMLEEVFRFQVYSPPAELRTRLERLDRPPRIVDLGGHVGLFGLYALTLWPDASVVSFEPDPASADLLEASIEANSLGNRWSLVRACAGVDSRTVEFVSAYQFSGRADAVGAMSESRRRLLEIFPFLGGSELMTTRPITVAQVDAFPWLREADLVKIDIEGSEWELLEDERMGEVGAEALVLEYHGAALPDPDPRRRIRELLRATGLEPGPEAVGRPGEGVIWGVRGAGSAP